MKIQYFVKTKGTQPEDYAVADKLRKQGHKVIFGNGDFTKGFQTTCDAVYLSHDFPHIEAWAVSKGIKVMKPEPAVVVAEPKKEVETNAETLSDTEGQEEKTEEEVKPRRGRRKAAGADPDSTSDSE